MTKRLDVFLLFLVLAVFVLHEHADAQEVRTVVQTGHLVGITDYDISSDGKYAATYDGRDRLVLWNLTTGRQIRETRSPYLYRSKVYFNSKSTAVVCVGRNSTVAFDVETGDQIGYWPTDVTKKGVYDGWDDSTYVNPLVQRMSAKRCPASMRCEISGTNATVKDAQSGRSIAYLHSDVDSIAYLATHRYDQKGAEETSRWWWMGTRRPFLFDFKTGRVTGRVDYPRPLAPKHWRDKDGNLLIWDGETELFRFDFLSGSKLDSIRLPGKGMIHSLTFLADNKTLVYDRANQIWSVNTKRSDSIALPYIEYQSSMGMSRWKPTEYGSDVVNIDALDAPNEYMLSLAGIYSPLRMTVGKTEGKVYARTGSYNGPNDVANIGKNIRVICGSRLVSVLKGDTLLMQIKASKANKANLFGDYLGVVNYSGDLSLYDLNTAMLHKVLHPHTARINSLQHHPNYNMSLSASDDGTVAVYDSKKGEVLAYLTTRNDGEDYIIRTPDNYYMSSAYGTDMVHFTVGTDTYLFDQFDLKYNRPDIVLQRIGIAEKEQTDMLYRAYQKRLRRMNFTEEMLAGDFHVPTLRIVNADQLRKATAREQNIVVEASDTKYGIASISVWLNGVPVMRKDNPAKARSLSLPLTLASGKNTIQVSCLNSRGAESYRQTVEVNIPEADKKPDLWIACVGASKYSDQQYNLVYASKDARDVAASLEKLCKTDYNTVHTMTLLDEEVKRGELQRVSQFFSQAKRDDCVILFYAGHGMVDANYDYFLASYDTDFLNPSANAIPYEEFEALIDGVAPLRKLMLIDACHSGSIDKEDMTMATVISTQKVNGKITFRAAGVATPQMASVEAEQLNTLISGNFTNLQRGNGATIISSAGGMETAIEGEEWNNGLFSYCLLQGLNDRSADTNHDGKLSVSELQRYCQAMVSSLSGGRQQPTSRTENRLSNFNLTTY